MTRMREIGIEAGRRMYQRGALYRRIKYPWCPYTRNSTEARVWMMGWEGSAKTFARIFHGSPDEGRWKLVYDEVTKIKIPERRTMQSWPRY